MRQSKKDRYLNIAKTCSEGSTCLRRKYGAIIVNNDEIVGTGYNGSARGELNCCDTGKCIRKEQNIPHGEQYEKCVAVHAEMNAIISAGRKLCQGATLYLSGIETETGNEVEGIMPCSLCMRVIKNAGIKEVVGNSGVLWPRTRGFSIEAG